MTSKFNSHSPGYAEYTKLKRRQAVLANGFTRPANYGVQQIENKTFGTDSVSMVLMQGGLDLGRTLPNPDVLLITAPILTYTSGSVVTFPPLPGSTTTYKLFNNAGNALIADLGPNTNFSIPALLNAPANLSPNTSYTVYVAGSNSLGLSPQSSTITFTTPPAPPTITISGSNLTIPSSTGATSYRLISSPAITPQPVIAPGTTSFSALGLTPGTTYNLSVATTGPNGIESLPGTTVTSYTPPNPIQTVSYGASTSSTAQVSWSPPSVGGVTGYNIYDGSTLYATVSGPTVTFGAVSGQPALAAGTTFTNFSVKAYYNTPNNESPSIPLTFQTIAGAPNQPSLNLTSKTTNSVSLSWAPGSGTPPTGYILTQNGTLLTLSPVTSTSITISTGISAGTMYNYTVTAYAGPTTNTSPPASLVVYTTPNPIQNVTYGTSTTSTAPVSWSAPSGGVTGYNIYDGSTLYATVSSTTLTFGTVSGQPALTSGTTYTTFNVKAYYNTPTNESTSVSLTFQTSFGAPNQPSLSLTSKSTNSVSLSWAPGTGPAPTGYILSQNGTQITSASASTTSINITSGINPGTLYTYSLTAFIGTTTNASPPATLDVYTTPNPIVTVVYGVATSSTAQVSWSPPSLGGVTGYNIYDGSTLYTRISVTNITFGAVSGQPALASATTYTNFSVKAYYNTPTNESTSVPLTFQTLTDTPTQPTLTLSAKTKNSVSLSWTPGPGAIPTGYILTQDGSPVTLSPVSSTSRNITVGIVAGTKYSYSLTAYAGLTTNASPPATLDVYTPPDTPVLITSNVTSTQATLALSVLTGGFTGYNIYLGDVTPANLYTTTTNTSIVLGSSGLPALTYDIYYTFNVVAYFNTVDNESVVEPLVLALPPPVSPFTFSDSPANTTITGLQGYTSNYTGRFPNVIPSTVTSIAPGAFITWFDMQGPTSGKLIFPSSVTSIGDSAFFSCRKLTAQVSFSKGLKYIGVNTFNECMTFTGPLIFPEGILTIKEGAFGGCPGLTGPIIFPSSVIDIGISDTFNLCTGLTGHLTIPLPLTYIGDRQFRFTKITGITFHSGITQIKYGGFSDCGSLTGIITIPQSVQNIDQFAFLNCNNPGLTLRYYGTSSSGSATVVHSQAFQGVVNLVVL
jgi:hypothetical protein